MSQSLLTESPGKAKQQSAYSESHPASSRSFQAGLNPILQLHRTLGNHRVAQLIKAKRLTPGGKIIGLHPKLTIGAADNQYEQEADRARQVVSMQNSVTMATFQQKAMIGDDGSKAASSTVQPKPLPLAPSITPVQRQSENAGIEENKDKEDKSDLLHARLFNKSFEPPLQRLISTDEEESDQVQKTASTQREIPSGDDYKDQTLHTKPLNARRQPGAEEEEPASIRPKSAGSLADSFEAGEDVESRLSQSKGQGSLLPDSVRSYMEPRFGVDFSHVRVHTGSDALQMNQAIGAQAFTHGSDIYFGEGRNPNNMELTAHELTHVVQQSRPDLIVQRQPKSQHAGPEIKFRIGWLTSEGAPVETNEQVAAIARLAIASLQDDLGDVESAAVKTQVTEWMAMVKGALPYFDRHATEKVDPSLVGLINQQYDELLQVRAALHQDKLIQIKEALWRERDAAVKAAEEAEGLQPTLDDALRAAYRKGSSSTVKEAVSTVKGALSIGRNLRSLAGDITKDIMGLPIPSGTKIYVDHWTSQIGRPKITIINVGKYTEKLGKLGRGLAALNLALTILDRSKKATEAEQGMKDLSDAVSIGTDLISASPLSAPPHFSLYSTLYLKPALKVIGKQIGVLVENLSDVNRTAVEVTGDLMYPNAEPGGQEMFDLMVKVMYAGDESGFPALPSGVQGYLFDHREKLAIGAESDVPTEGSLFWKHLDGSAGRRWLFANRKRVWAMFYGSMKVPSKH